MEVKWIKDNDFVFESYEGKVIVSGRNLPHFAIAEIALADRLYFCYRSNSELGDELNRQLKSAAELVDQLSGWKLNLRRYLPWE